MKYLLDTDTCVYWLRGRTEVRDQFLLKGVDESALSVVTAAELFYGAACSGNSDANRQAATSFIERLAILPIQLGTAVMFGNIKAGLRREGKLIEDMDLLIAATSLTYDLILVTNNTQHFERIPNIRLENWAARV